MTFFEQLKADSRAKANVIANATSNVAVNMLHSVPMQAAKNISYKALVNTVGIGLCLVEKPCSAIWSGVERLAADPVVVKQ